MIDAEVYDRNSNLIGKVRLAKNSEVVVWGRRAFVRRSGLEGYFETSASFVSLLEQTTFKKVNQ